MVHKAFAGRIQDWLGIDGVVARQGFRLDRRLIIDELRPLLELKESTHHLDRLQEIFDIDSPT